MLKLRTAAWIGSMSLAVCANASPSVQELFPKFDVYATNANGLLAGRRVTSVTGDSSGVIRGFAEIVFKVPGALNTEVLDLNNKGSAVGYALKGSYLGFLRTPQGEIAKYKYPGSRDTTFNAINDDGTILGWQYTNDNNHGTFLLNSKGQAKPFVVPGYEAAEWYEMNGCGQILGAWYDFTNGLKIKGILYTDGVLEEIDHPSAQHTVVMDINKRGDVLADAFLPYNPDTGDYPTMAFIRRANGYIDEITYQPNWAPTMVKKVDGKNVVVEFSHTMGTSARAMDDTGRVIFASLAFYVDPVMGYSFVEERLFAMRP